MDGDPLGVLTTTRPVVDAARHVTIDPARVDEVAEELAAGVEAAPAWDDGLHFRDETATWRTAGWVFVLDALNFCFWSERADPDDRWRVEYQGRLYDGYWALAAALRRAVDEGRPVWEPAYLAAVSPAEVAEILRPHGDETPEIPLLPLRVKHLQELGRGLAEVAPGGEAAARLIEEAGRSAARLVDAVVERSPSFDDVAEYEGREVRFYKRAQILAADLHGSFGGEGLGAFDDLDCLTAFADYKVPQVLRRLGVIRYDEDLARAVDARRLIPAGSPAEVEIRAATIWGCELLRRALGERGRAMRAFEVDWALWTAGQSLPAETRPYHRTLTGYY